MSLENESISMMQTWPRAVGERWDGRPASSRVLMQVTGELDMANLIHQMPERSGR